MSRPDPVIMLDPGHGGRDPGAVNDNGTPVKTDDTLEKTINLEAALTMKHYLSQRGVGVRMTRYSDIYPSLTARTSRATATPTIKLFVSIHHDSPHVTRPGVYYSDHPESRILAQQVAVAMAENAWVRSHKTSRFGRLYINDFKRGPSILLELGPTAPVSREQRIHRVSVALVPLLAYLNPDRTVRA